jgi:predicted  nucleic acid-binding Zn-ribbon protein
LFLIKKQLDLYYEYTPITLFQKLERKLKKQNQRHDALATDLKALEKKLTTLDQAIKILKKDINLSNNQKKSLEPSVLVSDKPSKEELNSIKKILGLEKGCMQYKERGDGVYHVVYNRETGKPK